MKCRNGRKLSSFSKRRSPRLEIASYISSAGHTYFRGRRPVMLRSSALAVLLVAAISGCSSNRFARNNSCCPTYVCRPVCAVPCQPTCCNYCPRPCSSCGGGSISSFGGGTIDQIGGGPIDSMDDGSMYSVGYQAN